MSKVIGFIVGAIEIGIGIATGNPMLIIQGGMTIVAQAVVDLTAPKAPARDASEMTIKLGEQPRSMLVGETFVAGSLVDGFDYGGKYGTDWEVLVIRLADHKCASLTGFFVNDDYVLYTGDGNYPRFDGDHFSLWFRSDTSTQPLPAVVTTYGPGWKAADIGQSGCDVIVAYKADSPKAKKLAWPAGRPHFGFVVKGKLCYDLRKDSTVPGGAGPHRWTDPSTWEWSENAIVCWYNYERGVYANDVVTDQTKLLVGRGLSDDELAPAADVIAAANLCDGLAAAGFPYAQVDDSGLAWTADMEISADGGWMIRYASGSGDPIEWWNLLTRTFFGVSAGSGVFSGTVTNLDVAIDGTAYMVGQYVGDFGVVHTALYSCGPLGTFAKTDIISGPWFSGPTRVFDFADGTRKILCGVPSGSTGYIDDITFVGDAQTGRDFSRHADSNIWGIFQPNGSSNQFTLERLTGAALSYTVTGSVTRSSPGSPTFCHVPAYAHWMVFSDGKWYTINDDTTGASAGTIKASGTLSPVTLNLPRKTPGAKSFWSNWTQISLLDASTIETVNPSDWVGEDTGPSPRLYDPLSDAIIVHPQFAAHTTWRFLHRDGHYRVSGPIYANQPFLEVEQMFAAATAGTIVTRQGAVEVEPGQAKSVAMSFSDADVLTASKVSWNWRFLSESSAEWLNTVVATYVEPDQKWNSHEAPPVRVNADIIADGAPREAGLQLRLVRYRQQALRIAEIARRMGRLWGRATVTLGPRFCELEDGDWVQWQSDRYFGGGAVIFRIKAYSIDQKWQNTLTLEEISGEVFADDATTFARDQTTPVTTRPPPGIGTPSAGNWALAATTLVSSGASVPALEITGSASDDGSAEAILVEYWKSDGVTDPTVNPDSIAWTSFGGRFPPDTTKIDITSLAGLGTYYVALRYVVSGIPGDRLVKGPVTIGDLDVSGQVTPLINASPWKAAVRAKTTAALPVNAYANGTAGVGATLTGTANGALAAQDGVALAAGERLLVANEAAGAHNGIYVLTQAGSVSAPYILTRTADADGGGELVNACVKVSEGTAAADQEWQCTTNAPIVVGTTALAWAQTSGAVTSATVQASEAIAANDFTNVYSSGGATRVRRANAADPTKFANGYAPSAIANGASGAINFSGINAATVITPASAVYLSDATPGGFVLAAPSAAGSIVQALGPALVGTGIAFAPQATITL